jgi:hypothetical protein
VIKKSLLNGEAIPDDVYAELLMEYIKSMEWNL